MNYQRCTQCRCFDALKEIGSNPVPVRLGVRWMLVASVGCTRSASWRFGRTSYAMQAEGDRSASTEKVSGMKGLLVLLPFLLVTLVALAAAPGRSC